MKQMTATEIRNKFISYFESKGHRHIDSSSLVPYNDETLLFTNAGMVQFKDVFLGAEKRDYTRAVTAQRCVRAGGKHNDLDTVGRTARHHTFFEMLGNFSFGDYFKRDAIAYAWEFLTQVLELPIDKLYVTVYEEDDEAFQLWQDVAGLSPERIYRIGAKDNFWSMGDTGPCGPCSEIFFDRGEKYGCDAEVCGIGACDCDRWMEIWNLVFMQYDRAEDGTLTPLPRPSIDTGMGLERVTSIIQDVDSNYDTDIMRGIIRGVEEISGHTYHDDHRGFPFRVIADHSRACSFLIADGVLPSNDGRGYVLRRILRRAVRFGLVLGLNEPFLYKMFQYVKNAMQDAYPLLKNEETNIVRAIRMEEERFHETLKSGMNIVQNIIDRMNKNNETVINGSDLFMLYDTYGFPLDLARDIAEENNFTIDEQGFVDCMNEQRAKAKSSMKNVATGESVVVLGQMLVDVPVSSFLGYDKLESDATITHIIVDQAFTQTAQKGAQGWLILDQTPFYGESGGQVGDIGTIGNAHITDTQKLPSGLIVHRFIAENGPVSVGDAVTATVDQERRFNIARNHSATHLLHKALRMILGEQLHQAGSFVNENRLRFDFNHFEPLTAQQIEELEDIINQAILANMPINCEQMAIEKAKETGAMAFFGDKYGDVVRIVSMGNFSKEFCGGTHCKATGDIGCIKILGESGIGSGLRRIECLTGFGALNYFREQEHKINALSATLKTTPDNLDKKLDNILADNKALQKENEKLKAQINNNKSKDISQNAEQINGISILATFVEADDVAGLRNIMDSMRDSLPNSVIILAATFDEKTAIITSVNGSAKDQGLHAGKIVKEVSSFCNGSGGGRNDMAQAGTKETDAAIITDALTKGIAIIKDLLSC